MERDLKFCLCGQPSEKQHRKTGMIVYRGICSDCLTRKRRNIPDYVNKDWIIQKHINENLSLEQIATLLGVRESHVFYFFKLYDIKEIKHCKYCGTTENLRNCKVNNQWMEEKEVAHKVCQSCYEREKSIVQRAAVEYTDYEKLTKNQKATKLKNHGNENYNNSKKAQESYKNNPGKKQKECRKSSETKSKHTAEQRQQRIKKYLETMNRKSDEEKQLRIERMSLGVRKSVDKRIEDGSIHRPGKSYKATNLFIQIDEFFNNEIEFKYNRVDENGKMINREKAVNIKLISINGLKCRFLDFYFKHDNKEICIEFDEYRHNNTKIEDLIRETEILIKKPNLYIFRIKQEDYDNNFDVMFNDIVNLIQDVNYETILNYDCLTKQFKIDK